MTATDDTRRPPLFASIPLPYGPNDDLLALNRYLPLVFHFHMKKIRTPKNIAAERPPITPPTVAPDPFPGFGFCDSGPPGGVSKGDPLLPGVVAAVGNPPFAVVGTSEMLPIGVSRVGRSLFCVWRVDGTVGFLVSFGWLLELVGWIGIGGMMVEEGVFWVVWPCFGDDFGVEGGGGGGGGAADEAGVCGV